MRDFKKITNALEIFLLVYLFVKTAGQSNAWRFFLFVTSVKKKLGFLQQLPEQILLLYCVCCFKPQLFKIRLSACLIFGIACYNVSYTRRQNLPCVCFFYEQRHCAFARNVAQVIPM